MPKTSKFPIDVLVIQLGFERQNFWTLLEGEIQWQKVVFGPVQKAAFPFFAFPKKNWSLKTLIGYSEV